jgi:hypothetical protein
MRRYPLLLLVAALVAALVATGCVRRAAVPSQSDGGGGTQAPEVSTSIATQGPAESYSTWTQAGSAKVTIGGTTVDIVHVEESGGSGKSGCFDAGDLGVMFRFGRLQSPSTSDWISGMVYRDGSKPDTISGRANGKQFELGDDRTATITADGKGTFSGTDMFSNTKVTGTFACH